MSEELVQVGLKLPKGLLERVDAKAGEGQRTRFIREALETAVNPKVILVPRKLGPPPVVPGKMRADCLEPGTLSSQAEQVLGLARKYPHSERDLVRVLGWPMGAIQAAISELEQVKAVKWDRGAISAA